MVEFDNVDKAILNAANFLRTSSQSGLKSFEAIMAEKRVEVFKGTSALKAILSDKYKKLKKVPSIETKEDAEKLLQNMIDQGLFIRSIQINESKFLQPDLARTWSEEALYAWILESSQLYTILGACALLIGSFALVMFPLWPSSVRNLSWYVMMAGVSFLVFLIVISIIRLIVFGITYFTTKPGIWVFPNLYEDVGFFESFVPFWDWHKPETIAPAVPREIKRD